MHMKIKSRKGKVTIEEKKRKTQMNKKDAPISNTLI